MGGAHNKIRRVFLVDDEDESSEPIVVGTHQQVGTRPIVCPNCPPGSKPITIDAFAVHLERHRELGVPLYSARGILRSTRCTKGCGRWFTATARDKERRQHEELCDGSLPLSPSTAPASAAPPVHTFSREIPIASAWRPPVALPKELENSVPPDGDIGEDLEEELDPEKQEESVANLDCPTCGKKYLRGGKRRENHLNACKGPVEKRPRGEPKKPAAGDDGVGGGGAESTAGAILRKQAKDLREKAAGFVTKAARLEELAAAADREVEGT